MNILRLNSQSDLVGALASGLCLVHCVATPFIFIAQAGLAEHTEAYPQWWGLLDFIFLGISFAAVWWSGSMTSKKWMRNGLWASWFILALMVGNEKLSFIHIPEQAIYVPAIALVLLHLYNRRYCQCGQE